jgi:hypothetical protein
MARADDTAEVRWCARVAKVTGQSGPLVCRQVLKSLKFSLIADRQPVALGVVLEPPLPKPEASLP